MSNGIYPKIKKRIELSDYGTVFVTSDFADLAAITTVRKCLGRQVEEKTIRRIIDGVYEKPVYSSFLKENVPVNPEAVVYAIARNFHWTIAPCGDIALNKLGLSTQVPVVWVDDNVISKIRNRLSKEEKIKMLEEATGVSEWIYEVVRKVCAD